MQGVLMAVGGVLMMAMAVSAQSRVWANLHPVEGGQWEVLGGVAVGSSLNERICLEDSAYVLVGRVELGYFGSWDVRREGGGIVTGNVIRENDGTRWSWSSFDAADGQCFNVTAGVVNDWGFETAYEQARVRYRGRIYVYPSDWSEDRILADLQANVPGAGSAVRVRLYQMRVGVDW